MGSHRLQMYMFFSTFLNGTLKSHTLVERQVPDATFISEIIFC